MSGAVHLQLSRFGSHQPARRSLHAAASATVFISRWILKDRQNGMQARCRAYFILLKDGVVAGPWVRLKWQSLLALVRCIVGHNSGRRPIRRCRRVDNPNVEKSFRANLSIDPAGKLLVRAYVPFTFKGQTLVRTRVR
jgi:hypothetical protein